MEVWRSKIHSINESVCPGGALPRFSCPTPGNCQLKEKKVQMPGGCPGGGMGNARID